MSRLLASLYAFIRREGIDSPQAKDLTQSFFLHLLQSNLIKQAEREKGRFRSFLLTCLTNF
jgi:DNA-directed RNA polymerase specialized sigma24 family protein